MIDVFISAEAITLIWNSELSPYEQDAIRSIWLMKKINIRGPGIQNIGGLSV